MLVTSLPVIFLKCLVLLCAILKCYCQTCPKEKEDSTPVDDRLNFAHSPTDLHYLTVLEDRIFSLVKEYMETSENELELFFKRYVADYEDSNLVAFRNCDCDIQTSKKRFRAVHTNPLWAYRMLWRFVTDIPRIMTEIETCDNSGFKTKLKNVTDPNFVWPAERHLNSSMQNLLTLQYVYNLNTTELASGNISNVLTNASLSAIHCFEIAQFAFKQMYHVQTIEWLEVADVKRLNASGHPILDYLDGESIAILLEAVIKEHDEMWREEQPNHHNLHMYYNKIDSDFILTPMKTVLEYEFKRKGDSEAYPTYNDITAFTTLCKGGNLQSEKYKSQLYCWYESKLHPAWYINPQKMELYNKEPYVFQVYDFIGDRFIRHLRNKSVPIMERAQVIHDKRYSNTTYANKVSSDYYSESRTSMFARLLEGEDPKVHLLAKRISYITGLSTSFGIDNPSVIIQIAAYATGGYFNIHVDSLGTTPGFEALIEKNIGDRLATFMIYLNDVELGGHTAFTSLGISVPPVKGSALFWYDMKRNGDPDSSTWHGGCPVLLGEKWVANKWIHDYLNILIRKCKLNKDD